MSLIPEKRVDKNGRIVTRHVSASSTQRAVSSVPAPRLSEASTGYAPMTEHDQLALCELLGAFDYTSGSVTQARHMGQWKIDIPRMDPKLTAAALQVLRRNATSRAVTRTVRNLLTNRALAANADDICLQVRLASAERYYEDSNRTYNHSWVRWVAMRHVLNITGQDIDDEDRLTESQSDKCVALAHVLSAASVAGLDSNQIKSAEFKVQLGDYPELVETTLVNSERGEEIADFMIDRGSADPALVKEWFAGDSRALGEGVL